MGDLHGLRFDTPARARAMPARSPRRWWLAATGLAVVAVLAVLLWRGPLGDRLVPQARVHTLVEQAGQALARGHLSSADGSGARELYEAAMAIDPDRAEPRAGLSRVAEAALAQAREALHQDRFADAHVLLGLARELSVPRDRADALAAELREREAGHAGLDDLLAVAEAAKSAGHLDGDERAALPLYARVLELQPNHADALRGREDALSVLLEQARNDLRGGDVAAAATAIATARTYDGGHVDLPDTQARFNEELDALRRRADTDLRRGRIDAAVATWQRLLQYDATDAGAREGLDRAADAYAAQARRLGADFRFDEAEAALAKAQALSPDAASIVSTRTAIEGARRSHAQLQSGGRGDARRVPELLRLAREAEARGDLLTPPGDSAYDRLRAAQALAPRNTEVRQAVARLLPSARECFERGLSANDLARARRCLEARESLGEDADALAQAQRRLAQRWLAIADERLGAGQLQSAGAALASARAIDPGTPGLGDFQERLRAASRQ